MKECWKAAQLKRYAQATNTSVYSVGYCDFQYLLLDLKPFAYTSGKYGWNNDVYDVTTDNGYAWIVTGYRNLFGTPIPPAIVNKYEQLARKVWDETTFAPSTHAQRQKIARLRKQMFAEIRGCK